MTMWNDQVNYDEILMRLSLVFKYMLQTFLAERYSRRTSKYPKQIVLDDPTHMMSIAYIVALCMEAPMIDSGCSLEKEFSKVICMNP